MSAASAAKKSTGGAAGVAAAATTAGSTGWDVVAVGSTVAGTGSVGDACSRREGDVMREPEAERTQVENFGGISVQKKN